MGFCFERSKSALKFLGDFMNVLSDKFAAAASFFLLVRRRFLQGLHRINKCADTLLNPEEFWRGRIRPSREAVSRSKLERCLGWAL